MYEIIEIETFHSSNKTHGKKKNIHFCKETQLQPYHKADLRIPVTPAR